MPSIATLGASVSLDVYERGVEAGETIVVFFDVHDDFSKLSIALGVIGEKGQVESRWSSTFVQKRNLDPPVLPDTDGPELMRCLGKEECSHGPADCPPKTLDLQCQLRHVALADSAYRAAAFSDNYRAIWQVRRK